MTKRIDLPDVLMVAMHDGFYGCGTGAGRSNRAFLRIVAGLLAPAVHLAVLPVRLIPGSSEYDRAWHQQTLAILGEAGGNVVPVENGTAGLARFRGLDCFRTASASAAAASPAAVAALARHLAARGITGIYTATTCKFAVISVTAGLTVCTNGQQLWCNRHSQRHT